MDEEKNIYKTWITRNKTYCSDEQEMFIGYAKSKKLTVFDHYIGKYIVFDSLDAYWEMLDSTPKEYRCYEEVVFADVPQSPVIEISLFSDTRYPGTKIVKILRTILDAMLETFRTHYTDYTNIACVPSTLDDFVVMDEIVQKDGEWHYFFHIQATSFYFPRYFYCMDFREKLCAYLPSPISSLISRPDNYIFQLVGISGSYLLSLENYKRITPYSQFLGTNTTVNRNELFASRFSAMHDAAAYALLRPKSSYQELFVPHTVSAARSIAEKQSKFSKLLDNVDPCDGTRVGSTEQQDTSKGHVLNEFHPSSCTEHNGIDDMLINTTSSDSGEITAADYDSVPMVTSPVDSSSSATIFITKESMKIFQPCKKPEILTVYATINFIAVLLAVYKERVYGPVNCVFRSKVFHATSTKNKPLRNRNKCKMRIVLRRKDMAYEITSCAKPRIPQQKSNNAEDKSLVVQNHSCLMSNLSLTHHSLAVGSENRWLRIPSLGHLVVKQLSEVILVVATLYIAPNIVSTLCVRSRACRGRQNKHNDHIVTRDGEVPQMSGSSTVQN
ncbi:unnamed protein product [Rhizophagus irregularis]|uniref:Uncharacterized protein n=3 Tax=Rhizophagus irregularis TaxID=588596 RepID=A0A2I1EXG3_9GLOM|nr:hypothetical protein RhiirB3_442239 [Rhizophagus irregularis]CAB5383384.1 unnamed protein product [Rhizophagus irregularis]